MPGAVRPQKAIKVLPAGPLRSLSIVLSPESKQRFFGVSLGVATAHPDCTGNGVVVGRGSITSGPTLGVRITLNDEISDIRWAWVGSSGRNEFLYSRGGIR